MQTSIPIRSFAIGAATGLRTMSGPVAAAGGTGWRLILPAMALGELIVDKLPKTPVRTLPVGLTARALAGAFSGGAVAAAGAGNRAIGTVAGVVGALGAAYAGAAYRAYASRFVPPVVCALIEDGASIALARAAANRS